MNELTKEQIGALKIVSELFLGELQFIEHFYSGDKDTRFMAMNELLMKKGLGNNAYEVDSEILSKYEKEYKEEYDEIFNGIIDGGKKEMCRLKGALQLINGYLEN